VVIAEFTADGERGENVASGAAAGDEDARVVAFRTQCRLRKRDEG
jgi:hypothetical protein